MMNVCVKERERDGQRERERDNENLRKLHNLTKELKQKLGILAYKDKTVNLHNLGFQFYRSFINKELLKDYKLISKSNLSYINDD